MISKTRYPLPCAESESSGDDHIESYSLKALVDGQEEERSPSPLLCAEPESLRDDQINSDSLEALADCQKEEQWEIPLEVRLDDITGKHQDRRETPLVRAHILGGEGMVVPKRKRQAL